MAYAPSKARRPSRMRTHLRSSPSYHGRHDPGTSGSSKFNHGASASQSFLVPFLPFAHYRYTPHNIKSRNFLSRAAFPMDVSWLPVIKPRKSRATRRSACTFDVTKTRHSTLPRVYSGVFASAYASKRRQLPFTDHDARSCPQCRGNEEPPNATILGNRTPRYIYLFSAQQVKK